jgi:hypothetical protein
MRGCCGIWTGSHRIACPLESTVADGTDPQCPQCAAADRGRALARDAIADDGRAYCLYLAWFGPGLLKVGLTAAERGQDRLLEQGAITHTLLAEGRYPVIRAAEQSVSAAGLARERIPARAKSAAWWNLPAADARLNEVTAAREAIVAHLTHPGAVLIPDGPVIDQAAAFGLGLDLPRSWAEVTAVDSGACLAGEVTLVAGRQLLLSTRHGYVLVDMRRVAGWPFTPTAGDGEPADRGLTTVARTRPRNPDGTQSALF